MIGIARCFSKVLLERILALALRHCCMVSWTLDQQQVGADGLVGSALGTCAHMRAHTHTHTHFSHTNAFAHYP